MSNAIINSFSHSLIFLLLHYYFHNSRPNWDNRTDVCDNEPFSDRQTNCFEQTDETSLHTVSHLNNNNVEWNDNVGTQLIRCVIFYDGQVGT